MSDSDFCELPSMVHVINGMNKELEDLREEKEKEIAELKIETEKLKIEIKELKMERYKKFILPKTAMTNTIYEMQTPVDIINIITDITLGNRNLNN